MSKRILVFISCILVITSLFCIMSFAEPEGEETQVPETGEVQTEQAPAPEPAPEPETQAEQQPEPTPAPEQNPGRNRSNDSALSSLSVSGKTESGESIALELSPAFSPSTRTYSLEVPFEVVSLDISASARHSAARVNIPEGYLRLDLGSNRSFVYVTAEDGTRRTYQINTVRNEETTTELVTETTTEMTTEETTAETTTEAETVPVAVEPDDTGTHLNIYKKLGIVFGVAGVLLFIVSLVIIIRRKSEVQEEAYEEDRD